MSDLRKQILAKASLSRWVKESSGMEYDPPLYLLLDSSDECKDWVLAKEMRAAVRDLHGVDIKESEFAIFWGLCPCCLVGGSHETLEKIADELKEKKP